ncbi:MAG: oligosaccharide flippase family protein [Parvularculaceae bacterium]
MIRRLAATLSDASSLKGRALKGGLVTLGGFGATQSLRLASNLIMTRLLAPDAFGLMGVTMALQVWIAMISDLGIEPSVMRSKDGDKAEFLSTARTVQLVRCLFIAAILVGAALALQPLAKAGVLKEGSVFADPRLPVFVLCQAGAVVLFGLEAMRIALHNRKLDLIPVMRLELGAQILAIVSMITAAVSGAGVYSLAIGALVTQAVKSGGSYVALKGPKTRFGWNRAYFDEIFHFGKWLIIASFFGFLVGRGDQIIFGYLFSLQDFSFYSIGLLWVLTGRTIVETVQKKVAYPAFAELHRERPKDLTRVYRRMRLIYELGCFAFFAFLVLFSDLIVSILYTDAYQGVAHYMRLLSLIILIVPYRLLSSVMLTGGDSRNFTIITIVPGTVLFGVTPIIYHLYGRDPAIVFACLAPLVAQPFNWRFASKYIAIDYARESVMAIVAIAAAILLINLA